MSNKNGSKKNKASNTSKHSRPPGSTTKGSASPNVQGTTEEKMKDHSMVHSHSQSHAGSVDLKNGRKSGSRTENHSRSKSRGRDEAREISQQMAQEKSDSKSKSRPPQSDKHSAEDNHSKQKQSMSAKGMKQKENKNGSNSHQNTTNNNTKSKSSKSTHMRNNSTRSAASEFNSKKRSQKFSSQATKLIPSSVRMISGSHDSQTSADVGNIHSAFALPNPAGRAGGACTAALLEVLYQNDHHYQDQEMSWVCILREMRQVLNERGFDQIPQLTSSRMIDVREPFAITPSSFNPKKNTQRAVLIGINYTGQKGQLSGCHNDVLNIAKYLKEVQGFRKENVTILMDDGNHKAPTKGEIIKAYKKLVKDSMDGDIVFCHYSGHGGRLRDENGDEDDGFDETLIPVDFQKAGQIKDDELLKVLIHPMRAGVTMTCLMDCCHSGTVLDLPYRFIADGDVEEMEINERVNFTDALWTGLGIAAGMAAGTAVAGAVGAAVASAVQPEMMILGGGPNAIHEYSDTDCCVIV